MKTKVIAFSLFALTATAVAVYPAYQSIGAVHNVPGDPVNVQLPPVDPQTNERPAVEVVFVLDTTGSMSGLIEAAKEKIWSIATTMASAQPAPAIRMGLVAYRDRGDDYVTRVVDLSGNLDSMYARLMDFQAGGGGDTPESVNQALHEAVNNISWSKNQDTYKVVFLVGDAPPHMDYQDDVKYPDTIAMAHKYGILVNAIQCGDNGATRTQWQQIASQGHGRYFQVDQAGSAVAIATPFDKKLAELSAKLDDTRLYYGTRAEKAKQQRKLDATDKLHADATVASRARRAAFNASKSGEANLLGENELVDDVASGRVDLSTVEEEHLPATVQAMAPAARKALIEDKAEQRAELQRQISGLTDKRADYLKKKVEATGGARDSLDHQLYGAIREQAGKKGLLYEADAPSY
ncbi:MAG: VWA domain-containing protein [Pseudomonadota bacterium]|nr:MAG: VWA domain-containing protein [Pseudomonadota bacterium]